MVNSQKGRLDWLVPPQQAPASWKFQSLRAIVGQGIEELQEELMKNSISALALWLSLTGPVVAQGTIDFRNRVLASGLDAPICDVDDVTRLSDGNFVAQVWYSAQQTGSFTSVVDPPAPFGFGADPGYWNPGQDSTRVLPGIPGGSIAWIQIRVWKVGPENFDPRPPPTCRNSNIFPVITGNPTGSPPTPPAILLGLQPFCLIPEPSIPTLGLLGAAALLLRTKGAYQQNNQDVAVTNPEDFERGGRGATI